MSSRSFGAGDLRHRITLLHRVDTPNDQGGSDPTWEAIASDPVVWAAVWPFTASERFHADKIRAEASLRVIIRYRSDVDASMALDYDGRKLWIVGVINRREGDHWLELLCSEKPLED